MQTHRGIAECNEFALSLRTILLAFRLLPRGQRVLRFEHRVKIVVVAGLGIRLALVLVGSAGMLILIMLLIMMLMMILMLMMLFMFTMILMLKVIRMLLMLFVLMMLFMFMVMFMLVLTMLVL